MKMGNSMSIPCFQYDEFSKLVIFLHSQMGFIVTILTLQN